MFYIQRCSLFGDNNVSVWGRTKRPLELSFILRVLFQRFHCELKTYHDFLSKEVEAEGPTLRVIAGRHLPPRHLHSFPRQHSADPSNLFNQVLAALPRYGVDGRTDRFLEVKLVAFALCVFCERLAGLCDLDQFLLELRVLVDY